MKKLIFIFLITACANSNSSECKSFVLSMKNISDSLLQLDDKLDVSLLLNELSVLDHTLTWERKCVRKKDFSLNPDKGPIQEAATRLYTLKDMQERIEKRRSEKEFIKLYSEHVMSAAKEMKELLNEVEYE